MRKLGTEHTINQFVSLSTEVAIALDESRNVELRLRAAVESAPSGLLMVDTQGRLVLVNREIERLFGYPREEILGKSVDLLVPELMREGHEKHRSEFLKAPKVRSMGAGRDLYGRRKDGSQVPVEIGLTPVATEEGLFVLSSVVDITARRQAEERFRAAVESSPAGMVMVDAQGRIVLVNREVERMFGWERDELMGKSIEMLVPARFHAVHPGYREGFFQKPDTRSMGAGRDLFGLRKDATEIPVEIGLNPIETDHGMYVLSSIVDISRRKTEEEERAALEQQLRQAQKLEAVGTLAGGVAHDFNNILSGIQGFAELLADELKSEEARSDLESLHVFIQRGKSLVQKIQAFSRRQEAVRKPMSLEGLVRETESFLRSSFPPQIRVDARTHPTTPRVLADSSALYQVFMNLGLNAGQAMPAGGALSIEVESVYLKDSRVRDHPHLREGPYVAVSVRDTGPGIDPEIQSRMFEPFFTTKRPGEGIGLGLAIVHGIVREHGGDVEVESTPGEGTTMRVLLPAVETEEVAVLEEIAALPRSEGQRILYVDDEKELAGIGKRRLERLGYQVVAMGDPVEALELFRNEGGRFDAVVSDYLMPRMNGLELAAALVRIRPEVPVVLLTGFVDDLPEETIRAAGVDELLQKPATTRDLVEALVRAMAS